VLLDLQRGAQPLGEQRDRRVVDDGVNPGVLGLARTDEPRNVSRSILDGTIEGASSTMSTTGFAAAADELA
jgi:hypothetical protein